MSLSAELERLDFIAGCTPRSIGALEATWRGRSMQMPVSWSEAYMEAKARARLDAHDQHNGRTVAFLEGMLACAALMSGDQRG